MSFSGWLVRQVVTYPRHGLLSATDMSSGTSNTWMHPQRMMVKKLIPKVTYCIIPFTYILKYKILAMGNRLRVAREEGGGERLVWPWRGNRSILAVTGIRCTLTGSMSESWSWYWTIVWQGVAIGENWVNVTQGLTVLLLTTACESTVVTIKIFIKM